MARRKKHTIAWREEHTNPFNGQKFQFGSCIHCGGKVTINVAAERGGVVTDPAAIDIGKLEKKCL